MNTGETDLYMTDWVNRFRKTDPHRFHHAVDLINDPEFSVIIRLQTYDDALGWVIEPTKEPGFVLDFFTERDMAEYFCNSMGWEVSTITTPNTDKLKCSICPDSVAVKESASNPGTFYCASCAGYVYQEYGGTALRYLPNIVGAEHIANVVKHQIVTHYKGCQINYLDLIDHLKANKIDNFEQAEHAYDSLTTSYDNSMAVFYYSDDSVLIAGPYDLEARGG